MSRRSSGRSGVVRGGVAREKRQSCQDGRRGEHAITSCSEDSMSERNVGTPRKRGHQHHPRNHGSRRRFVERNAQPQPVTNCDSVKSGVVTTTTIENNRQNNNITPSVTNNNPYIDLTNEDCDDSATDNRQLSRNKKKPSSSSSSNYKDIPRPAAEGSSQSDAENEDPEQEELAKLRCTSERTEVVAERETRRRRRCADYPGLAFGSSIFSSDTMMKFSIIRNELHNIMNTQLKRVRSTVKTWSILRKFIVNLPRRVYI